MSHMPHHQTPAPRGLRNNRRLRALRIAAPWIGILGAVLWIIVASINIASAVAQDEIPLTINLLLIAAGANCIGIWVMLYWTLPVLEGLVDIGVRLAGLTTVARDQTEALDTVSAWMGSVHATIDANSRAVRQLGTALLRQPGEPAATPGTNGHKAAPNLRSIHRNN